MAVNTQFSRGSAPNELVDAALQGEPLDLPVNYQLLDRHPKRNDIVATRLAQNVGPLFGVANPDGRFGEISWLSHLHDITLGEIARGAPQPYKKTTDSHEIGPEDYQIIGREVYGNIPDTIVAATMNRFGPDTKSAVVLTGINRLLKPQGKLLEQAVQSTVFGELSSEQKLRVYGTMIFGLYRPQPLLVYTGLAARNIQRSNEPTNFAISPRLNRPFARCEIGQIERDKSAIRPRDFDAIDKTIPSLLDSLSGANSRISIGAERMTDIFLGIMRSDVIQHEEHYPENGQYTLRTIADPQIVGNLLATLTIGFFEA